eukprot:8622631-Karenia_brevis.AAC.1
MESDASDLSDRIRELTELDCRTSIGLPDTQEKSTDTPTHSVTKPVAGESMESNVDVSTNRSKPNPGCCAAHFRKKRTHNEDVLHGPTNYAASDREDGDDDLSDGTSDAECSDDADLRNMTCRERDQLPSLYKESLLMQWILATEKLDSFFRDEPLLPFNKKRHSSIFFNS